MAAARRSAAARTLLLSRALPAALALPLAARLTAARGSLAATAALPLSAASAQFRVLAALACPGDSDACASVARGEGVLAAALAALTLPRPTASGATLPHTTLGFLNDTRVAAATLLANLATRKGNDTCWSARPELLGACIAGLRDECVGVRAACAACLAGLLRNSVRLRVVEGLWGALSAAEAENSALLLRARAGLGEASAVLSCTAVSGCLGALGGEEEETRVIRDATSILGNAVSACKEALTYVKARV